MLAILVINNIEEVTTYHYEDNLLVTIYLLNNSIFLIIFNSFE